MRYVFLVFLFSLTHLILAAPAGATPGSVGDACKSLDRPNIDCACVGKRIAVFDRFSPDAANKAVIREGYMAAIGLENSFAESFEAVMSDPMKAIIATEAYDAVGGRPENITDYEAGCVIEEAPLPEITLSKETPAIDGYVASCTASTGDGRYCTCSANRKASRLSDREFEAYFRSFSDYGGGDAWSSSELSASRGASKGLSGAEFDALQSQARSKLAPHEERDEATCSALLWADQSSGFDEETRQLAGFEPGVADRLVPSDDHARPTASDPIDQARMIVGNSCSSNGNSDQYCSCYASEFETRVVSASPSPNVILAWALMGHGDGLKTSEYAQLTQSIPQSDHQAAGMMFIQTMDMGETCSQGPLPEATRLDGTPRERMIEVCVAENEDEAICNCMVDEMQANLSPDEFELMVDMREADYRGADDPLAEVAAERGLTRAEAEEALGGNQSLIAGVMGMNAVKCLGGIPNIQGFPGFPGQ